MFEKVKLVDGKMAAPVDYLKIDLYDILGVLIDASEKDVSDSHEHQ